MSRKQTPSVVPIQGACDPDALLKLSVFQSLPPRFCQRNHALHLQRSSSAEWICDTCETSFPQATPSMHCSSCDYDVCVRCVTHQATCTKSHVLSYRRVGEASSYQCDRCSVSCLLAFGCAACDFDLCAACTMSFGQPPIEGLPIAEIAHPFEQYVESHASAARRFHFTGDVVGAILQFVACSPAEAFVVGSVCRSWYTAYLSNEFLWRAFHAQRWPHLPLPLKRTTNAATFSHRVLLSKRLTGGKPVQVVPNNTLVDPTEVLTPIENCDFAFRCPLYEEALRVVARDPETNKPTESYCDTCARKVYHVSTQQDLERFSQAGECVSFNASDLRLRSSPGDGDDGHPSSVPPRPSVNTPPRPVQPSLSVDGTTALVVLGDPRDRGEGALQYLHQLHAAAKLMRLSKFTGGIDGRVEFGVTSFLSTTLVTIEIMLVPLESHDISDWIQQAFPATQPRKQCVFYPGFPRAHYGEALAAAPAYAGGREPMEAPLLIQDLKARFDQPVLRGLPRRR